MLFSTLLANSTHTAENSHTGKGDNHVMLSRLMRMLPDLVPLTLYCVFIFIQSQLPASFEMPDESHFDKLLHFGAYGVMAVLFYRTYLAGWPQALKRTLIWASAISTALYGLSDEIHQYFVPERSADPLDWLADAVGGAVGALIYQRLFDATRKIRQFHPPPR
ncbi:MAG TPA: VanZ family protein [Desulfobacterales bacterium]|nr:VanZ family protein [Desulfobacterales bacterium]